MFLFKIFYFVFLFCNNMNIRRYGIGGLACFKVSLVCISVLQPEHASSSCPALRRVSIRFPSACTILQVHNKPNFTEVKTFVFLFKFPFLMSMLPNVQY